MNDMINTELFTSLRPKDPESPVPSFSLPCVLLWCLPVASPEETEHMLAQGKMDHVPLNLSFAVARGDDQLLQQLLKRGVDHGPNPKKRVEKQHKN